MQTKLKKKKKTLPLLHAHTNKKKKNEQTRNRQHLSQKLQADRRGPESPLADQSPS